MITIFAPHHAVRLHGLGFDEVKIASAACGDVELIHSVASLWPRVYLSTGGATALELRSARSAADARGLVLLHCVCEYPTATHRANLGRLRWLRLYADVVGFSDHSDAGVLTASKAAIAMGADVIERHFTLLPKADTKDGVVSIGPTHLAELRAFSKLPRSEQTAELNEWIQLFDSAVGERPSGEEQRNLEYHSRRLRRRPEGEVDHVGV
jgi:N,N'-diacetyllegionaminate synthase